MLLNIGTNTDWGRLKKHTKFDDASGDLYVQLKHYKDEDWVSIPYAQAKEEQDRMNANKAKKSFLFKSPDKNAATGPSTSSGETSSQRQTNAKKGSFIPASRPTTTGNGNGPWTPAERMEEES